MNSPTPEPAPTYLQLRQRILGFNPDELGLKPSHQAPHVWAVLVEMGYEVGTATLVSLADGTTSLYYSTGGGMLGSGEHASLAKASMAFVAHAENLLEYMSPTDDFPLPAPGQVNFILLTYSGTFSQIAPEKSLQSRNHPLSPLFTHAQQTLTQLRLLAEKKPN
ncbi:MAG: hypothetical protein WAV05_11395 [Anaerolineales bacterium]